MFDKKVADKKYWTSEKGKASKKKYKYSLKGKQTEKKYHTSEQGKLTRKNYILNNSEKIKAKNAARQLPSKTCEIKSCEVRGEKHHADYSKPLEVTYLCSKHHKTKHKRLRQREPQRPN